MNLLLTREHGVRIPELSTWPDLKKNVFTFTSRDGDPTDMNEFHLTERKAFSGLALAIIQSEAGTTGTITITAKSPGLKEDTAQISSR